MQIRRFFLISVLTALALTLGACASNPEPAQQSKLAAIGVANNWVKASEFSDQVGGMTGVFADITNNTDAPIRLIGGESSFASMVEVHEVVDGNMRMRDGGIGDFGYQETTTITLEKMLAKESAAGEENYSPMPMTAK
ncbi:MAG: hypothetical protein RL600_1091 [Actinomycetota bacterium]